MKRALLLLLLPLMACSKPSPLRQVDCVIEEQSGGSSVGVGPKVGDESGGWIVDIETGQEYEYDKFKEDFAPLPPEKIIDGTKWTYRSALVNGKWKSEAKFPGEYNFSKDNVSTFELDLKTMKYEEEEDWEYYDYPYKSSGTCKFVEPEAPEK